MAPLLLPEGSLETVKSELQIFDRPEYQVSQLSGSWQEFKPVTSCVGTNVGTPIQIDVPRAEGMYTDLANSFLQISCTIVTGTADAAIAKDAKVAMVNLALSSLFRDVTLLINNQKVEGDSQMYSYKAYIYNLLAASVACKKHQLAAAGWVTDDAKKFDAEDNEGYKTRRSWTATANGGTSKVCYLAGPLFLDVAMQKQYLTDKMNLTFKFTRNSHAFALQSFETNDATTESFKIRFLTMSLWLRRVQVAPGVIVGHLKGLGNQNAIWKYPAFKVINTFHSSGISNISIPDATPGIYPKCIFVAMLENNTYNGTYKKNPFNFQHFNVSSMSFMMNGQFVPSTAFEPDFASENVLREYLTLYLATGKFGIHEDDNGILLSDYMSGSTIFPFTFSPDLSLDGFAQPIRMVNIRLDIKFKTALTTNITLLLFCLCDTLFEIAGNNLVLLDNTQMPN
jgi:hypothetical protein